MNPVSCHRCGYLWVYQGSSEKVAKCPRCKTSVTLALQNPAMLEAVEEVARVRQNIEVTCYRDGCGHRWTYTGTNPYLANCPKCYSFVTFARMRELEEEKQAGPVYEPGVLTGRPLKR